jgi:hypothetical protein
MAHTITLLKTGTYELRVPTAHHVSYHESMTAALIMLFFICQDYPSVLLH